MDPQCLVIPTEQTCKWDKRFLDLAFLVASWSKDPSSRHGAVIVRPDRTVASVGYNGFPRQMEDTKDRLMDRDSKLSRTVHAELNALLSAREPVRRYSIYITGTSCDRCLVHLVQAGITEFIFAKDQPHFATRWAKEISLTWQYLREMSLPAREMDMSTARYTRTR
jgi:dCMP deaminase